MTLQTRDMLLDVIEAKDRRIAELEARLAVNAAPQTLGGMIAAIYGNLDAEDCTRIDREWMKFRGINAAPQTAGERLWCLACGTVTGNMVCDCNGWPDGHEMKREPNFVNYADEMQKTAHEQAQEIERLRGELERARGLLTLTLHTEAHSQAESAWQDISTAPKDGTRILVGTENRFPKNTYVARWFKDGWSVGILGGEWTAYPTHWMPIAPLSRPEQPAAEKTKGDKS